MRHLNYGLLVLLVISPTTFADDPAESRVAAEAQVELLSAEAEAVFARAKTLLAQTDDAPKATSDAADWVFKEGSTTEIVVDCTGQDGAPVVLPQRLPGPAGPLTITLSGICEGNLVIDRDDVTIQGTDPLVDGIRSAVPEDDQPTVLVRNAVDVNLSNLSISGSGGDGLSFVHGGGSAVNCRIEDNAGTGVRLTHSTAFVDDSVIAGNGGVRSGGGVVLSHATLGMTGTQIDQQDIGFYGILGFTGSNVFVVDGTIEASTAVLGDELVASFRNTHITGPGSSFYIQRDSSITGTVSRFTGPMVLLSGASIELLGSRVENGFLFVLGDSYVGGEGITIGGESFGTAIEGFVFLLAQSRGYFPRNVSVDLLFCEEAADAYCTANNPFVFAIDCDSCR